MIVLGQNEDGVALFLVVCVQLQGVLGARRVLLPGIQANLTTTDVMIVIVGGEGQSCE